MWGSGSRLACGSRGQDSCGWVGEPADTDIGGLLPQRWLARDAEGKTAIVTNTERQWLPFPLGSLGSPSARGPACPQVGGHLLTQISKAPATRFCCWCVLCAMAPPHWAPCPRAALMLSQPLVNGCPVPRRRVAPCPWLSTAHGPEVLQS